MRLVAYERKNHIATITLNRPEVRNAINGALRRGDACHAMSHLRDPQGREGITDRNTRTKVVVGGYAGTVAANRLRVRADIDITLVNPRPKFVERIRLHQFVARTGDATVDYGALLGDGVQLVVDSAIGIDTATRTVRLASGRMLDYDYVIYAVGRIRLSHRGTGTRSAVAAKLDELRPDAPVTVVGAGLTGIEIAAELAEQGRKVMLVCGGRLAPAFPGRPGGRRPNC
jgi:NADH dehydrogenase